MAGYSLGDSTYVSLTTYRKSGEPVSTPVWVAPEGDHLYVITERSSGKVRRLRHTDRVALAPCGVRGRVLGEYVAGTAEVVDDPSRARELISAKYGRTAQVFGVLERVRGLFDRLPHRSKDESGRVGIRIELLQ